MCDAYRPFHVKQSCLTLKLLFGSDMFLSDSLFISCFCWAILLCTQAVQFAQSFREISDIQYVVFDDIALFDFFYVLLVMTISEIPGCINLMIVHPSLVGSMVTSPLPLPR